MTPGKFLRLIWPSTGWYCITHPFKPQGSDQVVHAQKVFATISEAVTHVHENIHTTDTFFAVLSLREERVWDPTKTDPKTGALGAYAVRLQSNSLAAKALFFDLDVGSDAAKYASQKEALEALTAFLQATLLPQPTLVSSGGGVHVYWHFDADMPAVDWREMAWHMRQLAEHLKLRVDPTRTIDSSSVLRVVGTHNWKDRSNPRPVVALQEGVVTSIATLKQIISDAMIRHGVTATSAPAKTAAPLPNPLGVQTFNDFGPPPTLEDVGDACKQVREIVASQLKRDHPFYAQLDNTSWYRGMLGTLRHVEDGENLCRKLTALHPRTNADVEAKLQQLAPIPPTRCESIRQIMPWKDTPCQGCRFYPGGVQDPSVPSPIVAARRTAVAAPPSAAPAVPGATTPPAAPSAASATSVQPPPLPMSLMAPSPAVQAAMIPNPPRPYERLKSGEIALNRKDKDGNDQQVIIYRNDLYPLKRLVNPAAGVEQQLWRVVLPRIGAKDFVIDSDALYDMRKFVHACANNGLYPNKADLPALQDYMVAYISQLQKSVDADTQTGALGWNEDYDQFTLPDKILHADGTVRAAALTDSAKIATQHVSKRGTMADQVHLLRFYDHPDYVANQFAILASFGSLILHMTGHHGVVVNMSGESGASKSTTLYAAASIWGHPKLWPINGTNRGATANARSQRIATNGNLPTCVDEITHLPPKDAVDLAMSISQPGHRLRLGADGSEKVIPGGQTKSSIMLATANSSLHALLSTDNAAGTAGSMRVFEMRFPRPRVHSKAEADEFLRQLEQHHGHLGEVFAQVVVRGRAAVEKRVQQVMREIDNEGSIAASERYWSAVIAANLVAGELLTALRLISYDMAAMRRWAIQVQVPYMRGVVKEEYRDPLAVLTDYIAEKHANIVVIEKATAIGQNTNGQPSAGLKDFASNHVSGALLGHYDMKAGTLYLLKQGFKDHCARAGGSSTRILDELHAPRLQGDQSQRRIVVDKNCRKTLGAGTTLAKGQTWCFAVDMTHPDIAGVVPTLAATGGITTSPPAGKLSVVQ